MKVKILSRNPDDYMRETKRDIQKGETNVPRTIIISICRAIQMGIAILLYKYKKYYNNVDIFFYGLFTKHFESKFEKQMELYFLILQKKYIFIEYRNIQY